MIRFALLMLALALPAFAQDGGVTPPVVSEPTALGSLFTWLALAGVSALVALVGLVGVFLSRRAKDSRVWALVNGLWIMMQTAVAHAERELRPEIQKALADGKLTPEEAAALKSKTLQIFRDQAATQLGELSKLLGLSDTGLGAFISGLLERAVSTIKSPGGMQTVAAPVAPTPEIEKPSVP
ncbi:MAG: hypothetical protein WAZ94_15325 [Phycisphaerales bacterium]|nr:hypothetical protein [Chloroflexota bacterium]